MYEIFKNCFNTKKATCIGCTFYQEQNCKFSYVGSKEKKKESNCPDINPSLANHRRRRPNSMEIVNGNGSDKKRMLEFVK